MDTGRNVGGEIREMTEAQIATTIVGKTTIEAEVVQLENEGNVVAIQVVLCRLNSEHVVQSAIWDLFKPWYFTNI